LTLAAYLTYADFCSLKGTKASRIFKGFSQASAGPLWALLRQSLDAVGKRAWFSGHYAKLFEEPLFTQIDEAVSACAQFKHGKQVKVDYPRVLSLVGNITRQIFSDVLFGYFEGVAKLPLRQEYSGVFRCARGPSPQFVEGYQYKGPHAFSDMEVFVIDPGAGRAIQLTPLYFWLSGAGASGDSQFYSFDIDRAQGYAFKATDIAREVLVDGGGDLGPLFDLMASLRVGDGDWPILEGLSLQRGA